MFQRLSWLFVAFILVTSVFMQSAHATATVAEEGGSESELDLTLRTDAAALPVVTANLGTLESPASHMLLLDYNTGVVLASKAADKKMYPSSMTKMMTLYMLFDRLQQGTLSLSSKFTASEKAWRMQGSKMFVPLGEQISVEDLIRGIAIQSGNDACVVVAEGLAGSEAAFAGQMNEMAAKLGMTGSHFVDASGWPHADHYTTAHDLAVLAAALIRDFPQYYHYLSEHEFTYHGIRQFNRNLLLREEGMHVDGLKTGHTDAAGYGITLSAKDPQTGRRLILVVNGLSSEAERASEGERLLNWGFLNFDDLTLFAAGAPVVKAKVWGGAAQEVALVAEADVVMSIPKTGRDKISITASYPTPLTAPVEVGKAYGSLTITLPNGAVREVPLVAASGVEKLSFFGQIGRAFGL